MIPRKQIEKMANNKSGHIQHFNGAIYEIAGFSKIKLNGTWCDVITYGSRDSGVFSRFSHDFKNFEVVKQPKPRA